MVRGGLNSPQWTERLEVGGSRFCGLEPGYFGIYFKLWLVVITNAQQTAEHCEPLRCEGDQLSVAMYIEIIDIWAVSSHLVATL